MAGLDSVSDEVLLNISSHLSSIRDLAALSAQCRRLYNFIDMPLRNRFHRIRLRNLKREQKGALVLKILEILKMPKLAQLVHQLEIGLSSTWTPIEMSKAMKDEDVELIKSAFRAAEFSNSQYLGALPSLLVLQGQQGDFEELSVNGPTKIMSFEQAMGILFIILCPNIQILKVDEPRGPVADLLRRVNSKDPTLIALQRLREVRLINQGYDEAIYNVCGFVECMRFFHRLPSIESISASFICIGEGQFFRLASRVSKFSKIYIDHSSMSTHKLRTIIEHPKTLKEFRYSIGGRTVLDERSSDCSIQPKILGRALQLHKSSLQVLDLDADSILSSNQGFSDETGEVESESDDESDYSDYESDFSEYVDETECSSHHFGTTIGSFHDFTALTHLSIGVKLLLGEDEAWYRRKLNEAPPTYCLADRLPPNLEYLCIRGFTKDGDEHYTKAVFNMMETRAKHLPHLKEVLGVEECIPNGESVSPEDSYGQKGLWLAGTDSWASSDDSSSSDDSA
ncbi:hypothetical protein FQN54_005023 [Arachnomyces sp. PD_36]|nr:hypothetical protein FQN54_005023 [Arachnomyces sp. PD_36]